MVIKSEKSVQTVRLYDADVPSYLPHHYGVSNSSLKKLIIRVEALLTCSVHGNHIHRCQCDAVAMLFQIERQHCQQKRKNCVCNQVCNSLLHICCATGLDEYNYTRLKLHVTSVMYCEEHKCWLHLHNFTRYWCLVSVYGVQCMKILQGMFSWCITYHARWVRNNGFW